MHKRKGRKKEEKDGLCTFPREMCPHKQGRQEEKRGGGTKVAVEEEIERRHFGRDGVQKLRRSSSLAVGLVLGTERGDVGEQLHSHESVSLRPVGGGRVEGTDCLYHHCQHLWKQ